MEIQIKADSSVTDNKLEQDNQVSRRRLLKLMAITGGTIATSQLIPGEWVRPVINIGTLPAHAAGSAAALTSETIVGAWAVRGPDPGGATFWTATANFSADGTLIWVNEDESIDHGTWTLSGTTLTLDFGGGDSDTVTVSGDSQQFTTTDADGTTTFTKIA